MRDTLTRTLHVEPPDVEIAPLGIPGQATSGDTLLAGRFDDETAPRVAELVRDGGGEIVANVDESWTRPRTTTLERRAWSPNFSRDGLHA